MIDTISEKQKRKKKDRVTFILWRHLVKNLLYTARERKKRKEPYSPDVNISPFFSIFFSVWLFFPFWLGKGTLGNSWSHNILGRSLFVDKKKTSSIYVMLMMAFIKCSIRFSANNIQRQQYWIKTSSSASSSSSSSSHIRKANKISWSYLTLLLVLHCSDYVSNSSFR